MTSFPENEGSFVQSEDIAIRRMRDDTHDYLWMSGWLTDDRVLEFYEGRDNPHDLAKVVEKFGPRARGQDSTVPCIMLHDGVPIGYIQYYPVAESERHEYQLETIDGVYGVDLFIGNPDLWNQGIGTRMLSMLVDYLFDELDALKVVIDPQVSNHRAVRSYEKCGFERVKVLQNHDLHEGEYRDCWLMTIDRKPVSERAPRS